MVVSLTRSVPFMIKAVPLTKISSDIVRSGIISCIEILTQNNFYLRANISDNHPTNVSCYGKLLKRNPSTISSDYILNPFDAEKHIYLLFDTVHIIKNIRNNLLSAKYFQIPAFNFQTKLNIKIPPGTVSWSAFHRLHEKDMHLNAHLKKVPKVTYQVLHPGNNKQSVPLALAIFGRTTFSAMRNYFPEDTTTPSFLEYVHNWWLIVNSKEQYHPDTVGSALVANDGKLEFLRDSSDWLEKWME